MQKLKGDPSLAVHGISSGDRKESEDYTKEFDACPLGPDRTLFSVVRKCPARSANTEQKSLIELRGAAAADKA